MFDVFWVNEISPKRPEIAKRWCKWPVSVGELTRSLRWKPSNTSSSMAQPSPFFTVVPATQKNTAVKLEWQLEIKLYQVETKKFQPGATSKNEKMALNNGKPKNLWPVGQWPRCSRSKTTFWSRSRAVAWSPQSLRFSRLMQLDALASPNHQMVVSTDTPRQVVGYRYDVNLYILKGPYRLYTVSVSEDHNPTNNYTGMWATCQLGTGATRLVIWGRVCQFFFFFFFSKSLLNDNPSPRMKSQ